MKTMKIRLIATMVTLVAAMTIISTPVEAQRRSSRDNNRSEKVTSRNNRVTSRQERKSSHKREKATARPQRKSTQVGSNSTRSRDNIRKGDMYRNAERAGHSKYREPARQNTSKPTFRNERPSSTKRGDRGGRLADKPTTRMYDKPGADNRHGRGLSVRPNDRREEGTPGMRPRVENRNPANTHRGSRSEANVRNRHRDFDRYAPSKDYRGSGKYWGRDNNKRYRAGVNYRNHMHWDRKWEHYRWNERSWRDYYHSYTPRSYRFHRYYYHHHHWGHVIRRFVTRPAVFVHNNIPFYCYDGYFFRHYRGIGYVLTDLPYGAIFPELPYGYETVYINGYVYFRVGNLFFEYVGDGFQLVYYPERFMAYNY